MINEVLTTEDKQGIRQGAMKRIRLILSGEAEVEYGASDELIAAVGKDRADELQYDGYSTASDLARNAQELIATMNSAKSDFESAEKYLKGGSGHFNSLGILQSRGPRIDVLCATFELRIDRAVEACYRILEAIAVAEATDAKGHAEATDAVRQAREIAEKESRRVATERQRALQERNEKRCVHESYGRGRMSSKSRGEKEGRYVVKLSDGTERRYCGTHLKSATYGGIKVGITLSHGGASVTEIIDLKA